MAEPDSDAEKLEQALRAPADWLKDGGIRGPQSKPRLVDTVPRLSDTVRRSDQPDGSVTRQPEVVETTKATEAQPDIPADEAPRMPFNVKVLPANPNLGLATRINVYPGLFVTTVPTLYGTALNADPVPTYNVQSNPFSLFLRITVDYESVSTFRYNVDDAEIVTDDDSDVTPDITGAEVPELTMFWDDTSTKVHGHFYIKIADIDSAVPPGGGGTVATVATQWLFSNYRGFVLIGDDITVLA